MSKTLLLADDSVTIQRVIELTFNQEDVRVVSVGDGQKAVHFIDVEHPDIVLVDVDVAQVDGYAVSSHVKQSPKLKHIPVLLLAGAFEPVDEDRARASGCDGVLVKPFEPQQLVTRVNDLLAGRRSALWPAEPQAGARDDKKHVPVGAGAGAASGKRSSAGTAGAQALAGAAMGAKASSDLGLDPLDAALARRHRDAGLAGSNGSVGVGDWDVPAPKSPDLGLDRLEPEPLEPSAAPMWDLTPQSRFTPAVGKLDAASPSGAAVKPPVADAFSAMLAAEQHGQPAHRIPPPPPPTVQVQVSETIVEDVVRRVLARMTEENVRKVVLDTAERLIKEEIEKIKAQPE